jgi:hypothetical protein
MTGLPLPQVTDRPRQRIARSADLIHAVKDFIHCFRRDSAGHWTCIEPCEIDLPGGRIQVATGTRVSAGTRFMDVGIAELLDEMYKAGGHLG